MQNSYDSIKVEPQAVKLMSYEQFIADFRRNCSRYPLEFSEHQLTQRITSARKDPLNGMIFALKKVNLI